MRSAGGAGDNLAYGVDGTFAFFTNLAINTYWARTHTENGPGRHQLPRAPRLHRRPVWRAARAAGGRRYFNPGVGFVRRDDMRRTFGELRFVPRPSGTPVVRNNSWTAAMALIENTGGRLESREQRSAEFGIEFQNANNFSLGYGDIYEFLPVPFRIATVVTLPVGDTASTTCVSGTTARRCGACPGTCPGARHLLQRAQDHARRQQRPCQPRDAVLRRADLFNQPGEPGARIVYDTPRRLPRHLDRHAVDVHECAAAVQLQQPGALRQRAPALGIPPRQRAVRGVQRRSATRSRAGFPQVARRAHLSLKSNRLLRF